MKNFGFTLAEVLITLGIIGVVAALTLTTLTAKYQKHVWVNQLKRTVNVINNNFHKILADEGVDDICYTSLVSGCPEGSLSNSPILNTTVLKQKFQLNDMPENSLLGKLYSNISNDFGHPMYFIDGSCIIPGLARSGYGKGFLFLIDVNCDKKPNKPGYDRFAINFLTTGNYNLLDSGWLPSSECENAIKAENTGDTDENTFNFQLWVLGGTSCFAKIVEEGWVMNY